MDLLEQDKTNNMGVYRFVVNDGVYAVQEARDVDAILQPEDPVAPEGMSFVGWALEEGGAPLFVDADGDGQADPVIARADSPYSEVTALAVFDTILNPNIDNPVASFPLRLR